MKQHDRQDKCRRGATLIFVAVCLIVLFGFSALAFDMSYLYVLRADLQVAASAAATAGATELPDTALAESLALDYAAKNMPGGIHGTVLASPDVIFGNWDDDSRTFTQGASPTNAIKVTTRRDSSNGNPAPLFFANVFGLSQEDITAEAVAARRARDIMIVLDYSASMNDDSEFAHIGQLSRSAIEANLQQIYNELGAPTYGNMQWQPQLITGSTSNVLSALGLDDVPYPYPVGSWIEYINYVKNDGAVSSAGYRNRYGYMTLVNYWLAERPMASETPDLWKTSEQPITAVKNAVTLFLAYIQSSNTGDQVGLAVYTHPQGGAILESGLTTDMVQIETVSRQRQAGHYDHFTNIGAGLREARLELQKNARNSTVKFIVLMTDGKANRPNGNAQGLVLTQANLCAKAGFPVITISLGADADAALMQQVADITKGVHFNIPGGQSVADYEQDLKDVFALIANYRPTQLVK